MRKVGEDVTETPDYIPGRFEVIRHVRPAFSSPALLFNGAGADAEPACRPRLGPGLLAHVLALKYCDHLPLYRQAQIYAREGVDLDRATMADWVGKMAGLLRPLVDAIAAYVMAADKLHADDTPVPVLDLKPRPHQDRPVVGLPARRPAVRRTGAAGGALPLQPGPQGRASAGAPRKPFPWLAPGRWLRRVRRPLRGEEGPAGRRRGGVLGPRPAQVLRRPSGRPLADGRGCAETHRHAVRCRGSGAWAVRRAAPPGPPGKSRTADRRARRRPRRHAAEVAGEDEPAAAIRSARNHWTPLRRYLDDGRLEIDNNAAERQIWPLALAGRTISSPAPTPAANAPPPSIP